MRPQAYFKIALNFLAHSKVRSWLTIIGIVLGVSAMVAIISMGEGMQQSVQSRLSGLGADMITISSGGGRAAEGFARFEGGGPGGFPGGGSTSSEQNNLTSKDVQVLKSITGVKYVEGIISGRGDMYYLGETSSVSVQGVDPQVWQYMTTATLSSGRLLGPTDYNSIVIGSRVAATMFKQPVGVNRMVTIEGSAFKVVGVLASGNDDSGVYMPLDAARNTVPDIRQEGFDSIQAKVDDAAQAAAIASLADGRLLLSRFETNRTKDFQVTSQQSMQERMASVTQTMTLFLGAIAAVSLLVGAVGIANTMFTSVLEKTKEIGIMKAIGARNRDIMAIFVLNSALVGIVGGILGIALGALVSALLPTVGLRLMGGAGEMATAITPSLLIYALVFSTLIGVIAGLVPAYQASKLKPVDALRYE
jgi:putative ABC transport system permease protein